MEMPPLKLITRAYITVLVVAALAILADGISTTTGGDTQHQLLAIMFVAAFTLSVMFPLQFAWKTRQHLDTTVILAAALIFEPGIAMLIVAAGAIVAQIGRRESWAQFFFNSAQMVLQVGIASLVLASFNWSPTDPSFNSFQTLLAVFVAGAALYLVNTFTVAFIIALEDGTSPLKVWLRSTAILDQTETLLHVGQIGIALLAAIVADAHIWALALLLLPVAAMYASLHHHVIVRRRVEEALLGTEANLREAQRLAHLGSWEWNIETDERLWSDEIYRILGAERHEADTQQDIFTSAVHDSDRELVAGTLNRAMRGETPASIDHRIVRADGSERFVHSQVEVIFDKRGRPERVLATLHDITDRKHLEERLVHQAFHDPLTGLPNRALFSNRLEHALARSSRQAHQLAVLFLDLDHFKLINDTLGHDAGDQVLIAVAERVRGCLRPGDTVARLGGDEFTILLEELSSVREAELIAERITEALTAPFSLSAQDMYVSTSVGIVLRTDAHQTPEDMLRDADVALYQAKDAGRARYAVYDASMGTAMVERVNLEADLRRALDRGELTLHYQPQLDLTGDEVVAVEALVRWFHPERGSVSPAHFLPVAEESGLINAIDSWVLREACRQGQLWNQLYGRDLTVSVNVSGRQLRCPELVENLERILYETRFPASYLKLEISEIAVMADTAQTADTLNALLKLGVQVVIDDFGTGYSSLTQLRRFPIDTLKLDGTLVRGLGRDGDAAIIACAVIGLAHSLGLKVIAEGVEHVDQLEHLRELNCEYGQGNYFSAPLDADAISDWLFGASIESYEAIPAD